HPIHGVGCLPGVVGPPGRQPITVHGHLDRVVVFGAAGLGVPRRVGDPPPEKPEGHRPVAVVGGVVGPGRRVGVTGRDRLTDQVGAQLLTRGGQVLGGVDVQGLFVPVGGAADQAHGHRLRARGGVRRHGPILLPGSDICPQNPHTRPHAHTPVHFHTPRHYSVSAQVSAIPLRRRVVVELWWYEGALAPVDPQHRTGTRRDIRLGTKKPGPTECSVGPGFETSVLVVVVVLSVPPGDAAGAPPAWAAASSGPPPPLLARSGFGMRGQAAEPIPGGIAIVAVVVDEDAGTSGCVVPDVVADGG